MTAVRRLIADPQTDLPEQAIDPHFLDKPPQTIAAAERDDQAGRAVRAAGRNLRVGILPGEQPIDFCLGQAVMAAGGLRRADLSLMNPLLQGRVADAHPLRGGAYGEERHLNGTLRH